MEKRKESFDLALIGRGKCERSVITIRLHIDVKYEKKKRFGCLPDFELVLLPTCNDCKLRLTTFKIIKYDLCKLRPARKDEFTNHFTVQLVKTGGRRPKINTVGSIFLLTH